MQHGLMEAENAYEYVPPSEKEKGIMLWFLQRLWAPNVMGTPRTATCAWRKKIKPFSKSLA